METVTLDVRGVWSVVELYEKALKHDSDMIIALEALAHVFVDSPLEEPIGRIWLDAKSKRNLK